MSYTYLKDTGQSVISVTELAKFAYPKESPERMTQKLGFIREESYEGFDYGDEESASPLEAGKISHNSYETDAASSGVMKELPLEAVAQYNGNTIIVNGIADIVSFDGTMHTVEELKTKAFLSYSITPFDDPSYFAQASCYAYMLSVTEGLSQVRIRITYIKRTTGDRISYSATFSAEFLKNLFDSLINRVGPFIEVFAEKTKNLSTEIVNCPFPFKNIRDGQRDFVLETFRTIKSGGRLFVSAPTGIGKTMASLYPSVKAVGSGAADKIFYLTSKTVTGYAVLEAARTLSKKIPHLSAVLLYAKEQQCPFKSQKHADPVGMQCYMCQNIHDIYSPDGSFISYKERQNSALLSLLYSDDRIYTTEIIKSAAEEFSVCPYELALDLSMHCELIVCDYNYAYDDSVRFQRYFKNPADAGKKYVFLIDEAHNLPDRVRDMYSTSNSAAATTALTAELMRICRGGEAEIPELFDAVENADAALRQIWKLCREDEFLKTEGETEVVCGYYKNNILPETFSKTFINLSRAVSKHIRDMGDYAGELSPFQNILRKIAFVCTFFDEHFCFFAEKSGDEVSVDLLCLDPSDIISRMNKSAKAVVMFSATLSPMEYYKTVTGCRRGTELDLPSPYDKENLCLVAFDGISTRYSDRKASAYDTALTIAEAISAKEGNYIVYFSSYAHMKTVFSHFARIMPDITMVMQKSGMSYRERERFISIFGDKKYKNVVGFCVLGGMFSEGIDLAGEKLIGAIIVGTGIPGLSAQRNIMMEYYQNAMEMGREFAYIYPGMNKVLQAAGRVIRSESDRGIVLLIDDRYAEPATKLLFPAHWRHIKYTGDIDSLRNILTEFWGDN